jgi:hypothetical protein
MLSRVSRSALRVARRNAVAAPAARFAFFSTEGEVLQPPDAKSELAVSPKVQTVLDQILELNMIEIFELSNAIQVRYSQCNWHVLAL